MKMRTLSLIPTLAAFAASFAMASPAAAQGSACVNLLVGAGYAAKIRVVWEGGSTDWTGSFPIGKSKCVALNGVPQGAAFSTQLKAILGKTITCSPADVVYTPSVPQNVVYNAWGTTLSPKCEEPN